MYVIRTVRSILPQCISLLVMSYQRKLPALSDSGAEPAAPPVAVVVDVVDDTVVGWFWSPCCSASRSSEPIGSGPDGPACGGAGSGWNGGACG